MDSSFTTKPRDSLTRRTVGRTNNLVRTDLSPSQSVNAGAQSSVSGQTTTNTGSHDPRHDRGLDAQSQSLLNREREARKQRRERKDEALLRQKAYTRHGAEAPPLSAEDVPHADFEV